MHLIGFVALIASHFAVAEGVNHNCQGEQVEHFYQCKADIKPVETYGVDEVN